MGLLPFLVGWIMTKWSNEIKWITTPACKDCVYWNARKKECRLTVCRYPAKRGRPKGDGGGESVHE